MLFMSWIDLLVFLAGGAGYGKSSEVVKALLYLAS
jgi:hypothetical protein